MRLFPTARWAHISSIVTSIVGILTIIVLCVKAVIWLVSRSNTLYADAQFDAFVMPPSIEAHVKRAYSDVFSDSSWTSEATTRSFFVYMPPHDYLLKMPASAREVLFSYMGRWIKEKLPLDELLDLPDYGGCWRFEITNRTGSTVEDVSLNVPYARYALIAGAASTITEGEARGTIHIGNLSPLEGVTVVVWTFSTPTTSDVSSVRLIHRNGVGTVRMSSRVSSFWVHLSNYWFFYFVSIVMSAYLLFSAIYLGIIRTTKTASGDSTSDMSNTTQTKE